MKATRRPWRALSIAVALVMIAWPAAGQEWIVDASAGASRYEAVAGEVGTLSAIVAVQRTGTPWLYLAAGAPLDSAGIPWAAVGGGATLSRWLGRFEVGADVGAQGVGYRVSGLDATGGGVTLSALPFVATTMGRVQLELRSGLRQHVGVFDGESESNRVYDSGLDAALGLGPRFTLLGATRLVRDGGSDFPFASLGAAWTSGRATAWGRAGRWFADDLDGADWEAGARLRLPARFTLRAVYERRAGDPLYWNGPRHGWTVGLSRTLGRRPVLDLPTTRSESFPGRSGKITLRIPVRDSADAPGIAGDFTEWKTVPMRRTDDFWEATFDLAPGVYHYAFVRSDGSWFVPESISNRVDDGFGGVNAVLVVSDR